MGEHPVYSRHEPIEGWNQDKINNAKIVVIGAGGLGSSFAQCCARIGIGHLVICDRDEVELSNLNRQLYYPEQVGEQKALALADNLEHECTGATIIEAYPMYFQELLEELPQVFHCVDVILCLVDNEETRRDACKYGIEMNIPVIISAISRTTLNGYVFVQTNNGPCLNCIRPKNNELEQGGGCIDPSVIYTHKTAIGIATYATLTIIQGWERIWNYYLFFLDSDSYARKVSKRKNCEVCAMKEGNDDHKS